MHFVLYLPYSKKKSFVFGLDVCMMREKLVTKMYKQCSCLVPNAALYKQAYKDPLYCCKKVFTMTAVCIYLYIAYDLYMLQMALIGRWLYIVCDFWNSL